LRTEASQTGFSRYHLIVAANPPSTSSVTLIWAASTSTNVASYQVYYGTNTGSYTLLQNSDLTSSGGWAATGYSITNGFGTNYCTVTPPAGKLFFRLRQP